MARPCHRVRLESGLKLNLNRLARRGFVQFGAMKGSGIQWTDNYTGEQIASGIVIADMSDPNEAWFRVKIGSLDQRIILVAAPRHFGGRQWYFICPRTNRRVSVLWKPPGARDFACRQNWGRQVAYTSQFSDRVNRAHQGKDRINRRLCSIGGFEPDEWDIPPKPKWMRWSTYNRAVEKFDRYDTIIDEGTITFAIRLGMMG